jgi:ABC-type transport system involved in cytochrome c biogenesis permease subunit
MTEDPNSQKNSQKTEKRDIAAELVPWMYGIVLLFIFFALFQMYFSIQTIIERWFSSEFIPIFQTLYYLGVIALGLYIILVRARGKSLRD